MLVLNFMSSEPTAVFLAASIASTIASSIKGISSIIPNAIPCGMGLPTSLLNNFDGDLLSDFLLAAFFAPSIAASAAKEIR